MLQAIHAAFGAALLLSAGPATAQAVSAAPAAVSPPATSTNTPLPLEEMQALSGGQGVNVEVVTRQQLTGTTSGNTITTGTLTSGDVTFSDDALSNFSGVGNFVINTGANNTLQGAINISIVTAPAS